MKRTSPNSVRAIVLLDYAGFILTASVLMPPLHALAVVARGAPKAAAGAALTAQQLQKYPAKSDIKTAGKKAPVVVVRAKRKAERDQDKSRKAVPKKAESSDKPKDDPVTKKMKVGVKGPSKVPVEKKPNTAALGLVTYGSDSDSDN
ncbi:unnamed protein product [Phytophthora fragariaefolia]|uniref:Unnamed protein product n=1 Tax=Phytophthora fragariaefolia TaxID=1490495 RepID=A0A9W7D9R4_9STRA|nr:unnamed protein product [Phytophthora fragariaefolia]